MEELVPKTANDTLAKTNIQGRPINGVKLTTQMLEDTGVEPRHKVEVSGLGIYLSQAYMTSSHVYACVAYTPSPGGRYDARTYFLSKSQGVARLLRRYRYEVVDGREKVTWNDKGYSEDSLFLPIELQRAFVKLLSNPKDLSESSSFVFYGTAASLDSSDDYEKEVSAKPTLLKGNFYPKKKHQHNEPQSVIFEDDSQAPDLTHAIEEWTVDLEVYGQTKAQVFLSKDRQLHYLFQTDSKGRSWIAGIEEIGGAITSTGLWKQWVAGGDLTTPPWEYYLPDKEIDQTGGYGNHELRSGSYVDMWKNYLSKVPIIQQFAETQEPTAS